jgi:3-oxoadipate enol-lactonase
MARAPRDTYLARAEAAEREGMEAQVAPTITRWFSTPAPSPTSWGVRYAREKVRRVPAARWARYWRALSEIDVLGELGRIRARTRVIAAEDDRSTPPSSMRPIAAAIPAATFHVIPAAPHMVSIARPEATASLLAAWE